MPVHFVGLEVFLPERGQGPAQAGTLVQQKQLRPEVLKSIGPRSTGQADNPVDAAADPAQGPEPLSRSRFEAGQLVDNYDAERPTGTQGVNQPHHVLAVNNINVRGST